LDKASNFPELGSVFKAAFLKGASWFFSQKATELFEQYPEDSLGRSDLIVFGFCKNSRSNGDVFPTSYCLHQRPTTQTKDNLLRLIAVCCWNFHNAISIMDHGGILLHDHEAKEWLVNTLYENKQCCFSSLDVHTSFSRPPCSERKLEKTYRPIIP